MLVDAGFPGGKGLPEFILDVPSSTVSRQMAEYFKAQMEGIGIKIRVNQNTWPEFQNKIVKRQVQLYSIAWGADYPDAENFLQLLYGPNKSPGANGSGYDNPAFNKLYAQAAVMQDTPERTAPLRADVQNGGGGSPHHLRGSPAAICRQALLVAQLYRDGF